MNEILKRARLGLLLFGGLLALVMGLSGGEEAGFGWGTSIQNSYAQTVPPRPPDETTEPPPAPSPVSLTPTPPPTSNVNQDDNEQKITTPPPVRETKAPQVNASPTSLPKSTDQAQPSQPSAQGTARQSETTGQPEAVTPTQAPSQKEDEVQPSVTPTSSPSPVPAATQVDKVQATVSLNSEAKAGFLPTGRGSGWWVYALVAGVILLGGGIVLVRRA